MREFYIFISHAWEYNADYFRLEQMLDEADYFYWKNYSVPEHDSLKATTDQELINLLFDQIKPTGIVIILSGMYSAYRKWIQIEMRIACELEKPILGVIPWGQERIPQDVAENADEMVGWNTSTIVDAIRTHSL